MDYTFDPLSGELWRADGRIELAPTPARLLAALARRAGRVVSRAELWDEVWPGERLDLDQRLNYTIHQLRRALDDDPSEPRIIQTLPRRGYRFVAEVHEQSSPASQYHLPAAPSVGGATPPARSEPGRITALVGMLAVAGMATLLAAAAARPTARPRSASPPAAPSEEYRIARHLLDGGRPEDRSRAEAYLWRSLRADSSHAPTWAALGMVRAETDERAVAQLLLGRALRLDPELAEANLLLGRFAMDDGRWADAERHLRAAVAADPSSASAHHLLAHRAAMLGDVPAAARHIDRARALEPGIGIEQGDTGWIYYWAGRFADAVDSCGRSEELRGPTSLGRACLFSAYLALGDSVGAATVARREMREADRIPTPSAAPGEVVGAFLRWRRSVLGAEGSYPYAAARVAAMLGDQGSALNHLEEAVERADPSVRYAVAEPVFRELRDHPRFARLKERLGVSGAGS